MAIILLIQLSDWFYSLNYSEITQKKIKQFYYDKTMVIFCKGPGLWCPHVLKIEAVAFLSQKGSQTLKIKLIFKLA